MIVAVAFDVDFEIARITNEDYIIVKDELLIITMEAIDPAAFIAKVIGFVKLRLNTQIITTES